MRLLSRLEDERKSGAIWYKISRQSPKARPASVDHGSLHAADTRILVAGLCRTF
jgi:hypothetical protein